MITSRGELGGLGPRVPGPSLALGCFRRANLVVRRKIGLSLLNGVD